MQIVPLVQRQPLPLPANRPVPKAPLDGAIQDSLELSFTALATTATPVPSGAVPATANSMTAPNIPQPSCPVVLTQLDDPHRKKDQQSILGELHGDDRKLVENRLDRLPSACLRVLAHNDIQVSVYNYLDTWKKGANGTFEVAYNSKDGHIASRSIRVARMAIPGGISQAFSSAANLAWMGATLTAAGLALATVTGPLGLGLAAAGAGLAAFPTADSALSNGGGTIEHEITHALDQAEGLQGNHTIPLDTQGRTQPYFFSQKSPEVQACFAAAKAEGRFLSHVSKESLKEYFAEAGSAYLNDDPARRLNRARLREQDPAMFAVMENFFQTQIVRLAGLPQGNLA